jgi:hypothetical protein
VRFPTERGIPDGMQNRVFVNMIAVFFIMRLFWGQGEQFNIALQCLNINR